MFAPTPVSTNTLADSFLRVAKGAQAKALAVQLAAIINKGGGIDARLYERLPISSIERDRSGVLERFHASAAYNEESNTMLVGTYNPRGNDGYTMPEIATHEYGHQLYRSWLANQAELDLGEIDKLNRGDDWNEVKADADHAAMMQEYQTQANIVNETLRLPPNHRLGIDALSYVHGQETMMVISGVVKQMDNLKYPAIRAMANPNEWFAEGFREYMTGGATARERLQRVAPATYRLVDTLVHGGYFTKAAN